MCGMCLWIVFHYGLLSAFLCILISCFCGNNCMLIWKNNLMMWTDVGMLSWSTSLCTVCLMTMGPSMFLNTGPPSLLTPGPPALYAQCASTSQCFIILDRVQWTHLVWGREGMERRCQQGRDEREDGRRGWRRVWRTRCSNHPSYQPLVKKANSPKLSLTLLSITLDPTVMRPRSEPTPSQSSLPHRNYSFYFDREGLLRWWTIRVVSFKEWCRYTGHDCNMGHYCIQYLQWT